MSCKYAPLDTAKVNDVEKGSDAAENVTVGHPTTYPKGTVSSAWKTAFFVLLGAVLIGGGALVTCHHLHGGKPHHHVHDGKHYWHSHPHWGKHEHGHEFHHGPEHHPEFEPVDRVDEIEFEGAVGYDHKAEWAAMKHDEMIGMTDDVYTAMMNDDEAEADNDTDDKFDGCAEAFKKLRMGCAAAIKKIKALAKEGKITPEVAKKKFEWIMAGCKKKAEALKKKCGKGTRCAEAFKELKAGCVDEMKKIKEAAEAGKITKEEAKKKFEMVEEACKEKAAALKKKCMKDAQEVEEEVVVEADEVKEKAQ